MLRNLIHRLYYRLCDLWLDFKTAILHLKTTEMQTRIQVCAQNTI